MTCAYKRASFSLLSERINNCGNRSHAKNPFKHFIGGDIMPVRTANAVWEGNLVKGKGRMKFGDGAFEGQYSFSSRFEEGKGTNPEELISAAHAGCFSMAFSNVLDKAGFTPNKVSTTANVYLEKGADGFKITRIILNTEAIVPGIDEKTFQEQAEGAKKNCPVSQALKAVDITLNAKLLR
jgi:osmotically inducible protein OsmC